MKAFHLYIPNIDENILSPIFDQFQNIEELSLHGSLNYFNLDNIVTLRRLCLDGAFNDDFNFELLKKISPQLEELAIYLKNIDYEILFKLLNGHTFPSLHLLVISGCNMKRIEKKFIDQFPSLVTCRITNSSIETIEDNAFSDSKKLTILDLKGNLLKKIYRPYFSGLDNLNSIDLSKNPLEFIESDIFLHMKYLESIHIKKKNIVYHHDSID